MTTMAHTRRTPSIRIPAWLTVGVLIVALGLVVLVLRATGLMLPDVTLPLYWFAPGGPDVARTIA